MAASQAQKKWVALALALMCIGVSVPTAAQTFPSKPVRIIVAFPAGGGVDMVARLLASKLSEKWAQPVYVENKSGASGYIGTNLVATSPPDGYNVTLSVPNTFTIGPHLITPPYDALKDFTPITMIITFPNVLVIGPKVQAKSMSDLVTLEKNKPGSLNFASSGIGSTQHLAGEMFNLAAGMRVTHVPYKGSAGAMLDLIGGSVAYSFDTTTGTLPHIKAEKLRPIAVAAASRIAALPDVPTTAEQGFPSVVMSTWYGLSGPAGMPPEVTQKWRDDVAAVLALSDVQDKFAQVAGVAVADQPAQFGQYLADEYKKMGALIKTADVKAD
jgi:tripartite-type tricarboxylate transporter receptor subunit TctC